MAKQQPTKTENPHIFERNNDLNLHNFVKNTNAHVEKSQWNPDRIQRDQRI